MFFHSDFSSSGLRSLGMALPSWGPSGTSDMPWHYFCLVITHAWSLALVLESFSGTVGMPWHCFSPYYVLAPLYLDFCGTETVSLVCEWCLALLRLSWHCLGSPNGSTSVPVMQDRPLTPSRRSVVQFKHYCRGKMRKGGGGEEEIG